MSLDAMKQALEALEDIVKERGYAKGTTLFAITVLRHEIKKAQPETRQWQSLTAEDSPKTR